MLYGECLEIWDGCGWTGTPMVNLGCILACPKCGSPRIRTRLVFDDVKVLFEDLEYLELEEDLGLREINIKSQLEVWMDQCEGCKDSELVPPIEPEKK
jgi:hypothetical protein